MIKNDVLLTNEKKRKKKLDELISKKHQSCRIQLQRTAYQRKDHSDVRVLKRSHKRRNSCKWQVFAHY